jgi:hypothetical protein
MRLGSFVCANTHNASMKCRSRSTSADFSAQPGRRRAPCQLKTSWQASQQLRLHFVVVKAFAFACPRVPGRIGPFLRSPFSFIGNAEKLPPVSVIVAGTNIGFPYRALYPLFNGGVGRQFKKRKRQSARCCREQRSVSRLAQTFPLVVLRRNNLVVDPDQRRRLRSCG